MNDSTLKSGSSLQGGKYIISSVLGQGGFGITYEAEQVSLGRKVAVKEFFMKDSCERDESTSHVTVPTASNRELVSKFRDKFLREARMIAALDHDHIVKIFDVFEENGTAYYVMEHLGGGSLDRQIKDKGAMPEDEAVGFIRQIADALSYLHSQNILHFDVKPSNVLLGKNGSAKLIDFGISKHYDEAGHQTSSTPVGISKGYAPLEQYQQGSDIKSFTPATDIYALGATLYALLSGSNPPEASIVNEDGVPAIDGISSSVMHAIEKAMQPRRKDRPQSVETLLSLLDNIAKEDEDEVTIVPSKPKENPAPKNNSSVVLNRIEKAAPQEKPSGSSPWKKYGVAGGIAILAVLALIIFLPNRKQSIPQDSLLIDGMQECIAEFESGPMEREFKIEKTFEERWTYSGVPEWCTAKASEGKVILTVSENSMKEARTATVEFRKKDEAKVLAKLTVSQTPQEAKGQQQAEEKVYGSVKISSTPSGASIWIDGKDTKKISPEIIEDLTVGNHNVALKLSGYEDGSGKVFVKGGERAELTLSLGKREVSAVVELKSISLNETTLELEEGGSATLTVKYTPENATDKTTTWKSSNTSVAKVSTDGNVTAVKAGSATIIATCSGKDAYCNVTVKAKEVQPEVPAVIELQSIALSETTLELEEGSSATLTVKYSPNNATEKTTTWKSSNTSVAKVSTDGNVTAVKAGSATIIATCQGKIETCAVTVKTAGTGTHAGHEWVDLGLSVKWATCNVGATSPEGYGSYFAWGETSPKSEYTWANLKYCNDTAGDSFSKYNQNQGGTKDNKTRLELSDDAARANWGGSWRMPTDAEFEELENNCTWTWTKMNGKNGYKVVSKSNGNSIFLPAAGHRDGASLRFAGSYGDYWSSSLYEGGSDDARGLYFGSGEHSTYDRYRNSGLSVRPVFR